MGGEELDLGGIVDLGAPRLLSVVLGRLREAEADCERRDSMISWMAYGR